MADGLVQDIDSASLRPRLSRITKLALLVFLALMLARFALLPSEWQILFDNHYAELSMLGTLIFLLGRRTLQAADPGERLFYGILLIGFSAWLAVSLIGFLLSEWSMENARVFKDALFLLFSACVAVAIELRGDTYKQRLWLQHRSFYAVGSFLLVFAAYVYFAIIPIVARSGAYVTPYGLYAAIDLYLAVRFFIASAQALSRSWCLTYAYFGLVFLLIVLADILSFFYRVGYFDYAPNRLLNLVWYLWYPVAYMATSIEPSSNHDASKEDDSHYLAAATGSLLIFGLAMPLIHVVGHGCAFFDPEIRMARDLFVAGWIILITAILYGIYYLVRMRVAKLDADKARAEGKAQKLERQLEREQRLRSLSRLSAGLAHDFGNSLFAIASHAKAIESGYPSDAGSTQQSTKGINQAIQYAQELVAKLGLVGNSGRATNIESFDINPEIANAIHIVAPSLANEVQLHYQPNSKPTMVRAEKSTVQQVLSNYIYNAADAVGSRGRIDVSIEIRAVRTQCASCNEDVVGEFAVLAVCDDGPGVDATVKANIFEPLITTKPLGKGSGLGLAMIHAIMHRIGGHVGLISAPSKGTSFMAYFPL